MYEVNRIRIFVDFWNFELSCKEFSTPSQPYKIDWRQLPEILCKRVQTQLVASQNLSPAYIYNGTFVYLSYGPKDEKLRNWAENTLATFPGYTVISYDRIPKAAQKCQACKEHITHCPSCEALLSGYAEKGVDTKLAIDMISMAWDNTFDTAVLVSADRDFIPAVRMLAKREKKIYQVGVPPRGQDLISVCWDSIDLAPLKNKLRRKPRDSHSSD